MTTNRRTQRKTQQKHQRLLYGVLAAALVITVVVAVVLTSSQPASAAEVISPSGYQTEFASTGAAHQLIDVRTREEFASGHIPGAINIPVEELGGRLAEVSDDTPIVVYCRSGNRSAQASRLLTGAGYDGIYDLGGIITWSAEGYPVE